MARLTGLLQLGRSLAGQKSQFGLVCIHAHTDTGHLLDGCVLCRPLEKVHVLNHKKRAIFGLWNLGTKLVEARSEYHNVVYQ